MVIKTYIGKKNRIQIFHPKNALGTLWGDWGRQTFHRSELLRTLWGDNGLPNKYSTETLRWAACELNKAFRTDDTPKRSIGYYRWLTICLLFILVDALQCNMCEYDTSLNHTTCEATIRNCTSPDKFCSTIIAVRPDDSKSFTRGCVPSEVCEPNYCEATVIHALGRKSCNIKCCEEDLCNRDDYTPPVKNVHLASHAHWFLGSTSLTAVVLVSLFIETMWHWRSLKEFFLEAS